MHTFEQISAFVAVFEQGSYNKAALQLSKSRTTVREHVKAYEDMLGYPLFQIVGKQAKPTEKATQLYRRAKIVEKQNRSLYAQSTTLFDTETHTVTICYDVITPIELMMQLEQEIAKNYPEVSIHWLHRTRKEAMNLLLTDKADITLMPYLGQLFAEREVTWKAIGNIEIGCFTRPTSPLANHDDLKIEDLLLDTQYLTENFTDLNTMLSATKVTPKVHVVSNNDLLCELLKHQGWAVMPKHYMKPYIERGELVALSLKELNKQMAFGLNAFYCFGKEDVPIFSKLLDWLSEYHSR
ncbi:LysR family transcriptional regulator [Vibrio chaetopteri]|uniref:LysR family transcriptional regulator n=1 Tax=Vibrio chaetopteri TaxID=3016528 RepID=UPI003AB7B18F